MDSFVFFADFAFREQQTTATRQATSAMALAFITRTGAFVGLARSKPSFSGVSGSSLLVQQVCNYAKKAMGLPRCFFDLTADNAPLGRVVIEVSGTRCIFLPWGNFPCG